MSEGFLNQILEHADLPDENKSLLDLMTLVQISE